MTDPDNTTASAQAHVDSWTKDDLLPDIQTNLFARGYKNMPCEGRFEINRPELGQREAMIWRFATEDWEPSVTPETNVRLIMARPALKNGNEERWAAKVAEADAAIATAFTRGKEHSWSSLGKEQPRASA